MITNLVQITTGVSSFCIFQISYLDISHFIPRTPLVLIFVLNFLFRFSLFASAFCLGLHRKKGNTLIILLDKNVKIFKFAVRSCVAPNFLFDYFCVCMFLNELFLVLLLMMMCWWYQNEETCDKNWFKKQTKKIRFRKQMIAKKMYEKNHCRVFLIRSAAVPRASSQQ